MCSRSSASPLGPGETKAGDKAPYYQAGNAKLSAAIAEGYATPTPPDAIELKVYAKAQTSGIHRFRAEVRTSEEAMRLVQEEATKYMNTVRRIASPGGSVIR